MIIEIMKNIQNKYLASQMMVAELHAVEVCTTDVAKWAPGSSRLDLATDGNQIQECPGQD